MMGRDKFSQIYLMSHAVCKLIIHRNTSMNSTNTHIKLHHSLITRTAKNETSWLHSPQMHCYLWFQTMHLTKCHSTGVCILPQHKLPQFTKCTQKLTLKLRTN